jgi:phospholipase C
MPLTACSGGGSKSSAIPAVSQLPSSSIESLVSQKVKHVFVIVQENHTFDGYFGLYPGMNGQSVENLASTTAQNDDCVPDPEAGSCQQPFLITTNKASKSYVADAPDISGGNNGRNGQQTAIDNGAMDGFLRQNEAAGATPLPTNPTVAQVQAHNSALAVMTTYDCDTVPYLWYYAKNFTLFDHYFEADTGPSTPGNLQLFAGQIGQTEAAAGKGTLTTDVNGNYTDGVPISNDDNPPDTKFSFRGSYASQAAADNNTYQSYATLPVLLNPAEDQAAVTAGVTGLIPEDISLEAKSGRGSVPWAWYEEGFLYPADGTSAKTFNEHHTAPLYFDYINNANSAFGLSTTLKDNTPTNGLLADVKSGNLPATGVFWVKGGTTASPFGFAPADATLAAHNDFTGDDDHEGSGDSDHQVAEAYVATLVNAIAASKYWNDSVIILTWDDSGGMYDHYPPSRNGVTCPQDTSGAYAGAPCGEGVRLPMLVISPFSKTGIVVHDQSDAGSVVKFIETVFSLPTLASLPDEAAGVSAGLAPNDANGAIGDLTGALDIGKLNGTVALNPSSLATIPSPSSPPTMSCTTLGITPIPSPASVPTGFLTSGAYTVEAITGVAGIKRIPAPNDDDD